VNVEDFLLKIDIAVAAFELERFFPAQVGVMSEGEALILA
jgi:hypothetical protein